MQTLPDALAGRYELRELIGEGARKTVYRAWDLRLTRDVALALYAPEAIFLGGRNALEWEAQLSAVLAESNAGIVKTYDAGWNEDGGYLVMAYMAGGDLRTLSERARHAGGLPLEDVLRIGRQVADVLCLLHQNMLVHRDLTPSNIWLDSSGVAHVGDLDSAVALDERESAPADTDTDDNPYQAPESRLADCVGPQADLYSLGAVLYELLTGGTPQPGARPSSTVEVPGPLDDLIGELLAEDPTVRPANASIVSERLDAVSRPREDALTGLLDSGEGGNVEFKASLLRPVLEGPATASEPVPDVKSLLEHEVARTLAGFMNAHGGALLIGVTDDSSVIGIEWDYRLLVKAKRNRDGWQLELSRVVRQTLGNDALAHLDVEFVERPEGTVAKIVAEERAEITWVNWSGGKRGADPEFWVRTGNGTSRLSGPSMVNYIRQRWRS